MRQTGSESGELSFRLLARAGTFAGLDSLFALIGGRDDPKAGPYRFGLRTLRGVPHGKPPGELHALVVLAIIEGAVG